MAGQIDRIGFGWYQVHILVLSAGFIVAESSELLMASSLTNAISNEMGIETSLGRSMLMTLTFVGFGLGTLASGPIGDVYGRRFPMLVGYIGVICVATVTYFLHSRELILLARVFLGIFGGLGIPAALISISEVSPTRLRGLSTACLGIAYVLGDLWAATGLRLIMPDLVTGPWRLLLFWAVIPATSLLFFGLLSPVSRYDTPYFLETQGRHTELEGVLALMAQLNHYKAPGEAMLPPRHVQHIVRKSSTKTLTGSLLTLRQWPMPLHIAALSLFFFTKDFLLYGMSVFWPVLWTSMSPQEGMQESTQLLATAAAGVPGVGLAMIVMHYVPRRPAICIGAIACGIAMFMLSFLATNERSFGIAGVPMVKVFFPTLQMVTMLLPSELFPTSVRAWCYSFVAVFGRIATFIVPIIVEQSQPAFLYTSVGLTALLSCIVWLLPETQSQNLSNDSAEDELQAVTDYGSIRTAMAEKA